MKNAVIAYMIITTVALAGISFLYMKRGEKIEKMAYDLEKQKIEHRIKVLVEENAQNEEEALSARKKYDDIMCSNSELAQQLGLKPKTCTYPRKDKDSN